MPLYSTVEGFRFLCGIVVIGAAHGGRKIAVVEMGSHRHDVRISDLNVDAFFVQILEPALNVIEPRRVDRHVRFAFFEKITVGSAMAKSADWAR